MAESVSVGKGGKRGGAQLSFCLSGLAGRWSMLGVSERFGREMVNVGCIFEWG